MRLERAVAVARLAFPLRERTNGARVLVADLALADGYGEAPGFLADTDTQFPSQSALRLAIHAMLNGTSETQIKDDDLSFAMPLYDSGKVTGVVVTQRNLTEVATTVRLVRNALFTAAVIGLAVAVALGLALSSTLTRRLGASAALRLADHRRGPGRARADRPRPRRGRRPRSRARRACRRSYAARRRRGARSSSTASHELRTPLTMLQGTMELLEEDLRDGGDLADAQEQVASARGELRRLSVLATELLDLSRLDAAVQLRSEPVELGEIARAVAAEFSLRAGEREVELEVDCRPAPCWAPRRSGGARARRADPDRQRAALRAARPADRASRASRPAAASSIARRRPRPRRPGGGARAHLRALPPRQGDERRERLRPRPGDRPRARGADGRRRSSSRTPSARGACFVLTLPR